MYSTPFPLIPLIPMIRIHLLTIRCIIGPIDFDAWKLKQALLLEHGEYDHLDRDNLLNEIRNMTKREDKAFASALEVLLLHLLKYKCQPEVPEYNSTSWNNTIRVQRMAVRSLTCEKPSLQSVQEEVLEQIYEQIMQNLGSVAAWRLYFETDGEVNAKNLAIKYNETKKCLWSYEQIMDDNFYPDRTGDC